MSSENKFQIFRSSAGSGKTFTLVKEYFKIILENPDRFKHTLAITFTNKSTAEMKSRILETAQDIALGRKNDIYDLVIKEKPELAKNQSEAKKVLKNILHHYPQFSISTIDSFFSRVIRSLAYESGIPMQFQIELNNKQIIDKICAELYFDLGTDEELRKWLIEFTNHNLSLEKGWNLDKNLKDAAKELFNDTFRSIQRERNTDEKALVKNLNQIIKGFESAAQKIGARFEEIFTKNQFSLNDFYYTGSGPARFLLNCFEKKIAPPNSYVQKLYNENVDWGRAKQDNKERVDALGMEFSAILDDAMQLFADKYKDYITAKAVQSNIYSTAVLNKLDEKYSGYKETNQVLTINDYMQSLSTLIGDDDTPFVYEKVGTKYHHLLIDEFQDTSLTQWKNLKPLLINSLSEGKSSLVVGDAKQSIYRWRGSHMELLAGEINKELAGFKSIIEEESLDTNYRSTKEIVAFNNTFFHEAKELIIEKKQKEFLEQDIETIKTVYEEHSLKQKAHEQAGGYVELKVFPKDYPADFKEETELADFSKFQNQSMQYVLQTIHSLMQKNYTYRDICILVRRKDEIKNLTQFLLNNGIKEVVSTDSLFIDEATSVALLLNTLKHINNKEDQIAVANIIYHRNLLISEEENYDWNSLLKTNKKITDCLPVELEESFDSLKNLPLLNLGESLCKLYNLNTTNDQYLLKFLDILLSYSKRAESNLSDFLEWYETSDSQTLSNPESQNAIKIITIHSSKGLQFPVVIMPFANWKYSSGNNVSTEWLKTDAETFNDINFQSIPLKKELLNSHFDNDFKHEQALNLLDNLNLLYVAFTRAEQKLFIATEEVTTDSLTNTAGLINSVLSTEKLEVKRDEAKHAFSLGEYGNKIEKEKKEQESNSIQNPNPIAIDAYPFLDWESNYHLSLKDLKEKEKLRKEEIRFGNIIHGKLANINNEKELVDLINALKSHPETENELFSDLLLGIEQLVKNEVSKSWFAADWTVKNEQSILNKEGNLFRPDRVIYNENQCLVIDYKTGAQSDSHKKQVAEYCSFLSKMGHKNVSGFIAYLSPFFIDKL